MRQSWSLIAGRWFWCFTIGGRPAPVPGEFHPARIDAGNRRRLRSAGPTPPQRHQPPV